MQEYFNYFQFEKTFIEKFNENIFNFKIKYLSDLTSDDMKGKKITINKEHKHVLITEHTVDSFAYEIHNLGIIIQRYITEYFKDFWFWDSRYSRLLFVNRIERGAFECKYTIENKIINDGGRHWGVEGVLVSNEEVLDYFKTNFNFTGDFNDIEKFNRDYLKPIIELKENNFKSIIKHKFFKKDDFVFYKIKKYHKKENRITIYEFIKDKNSFEMRREININTSDDFLKKDFIFELNDNEKNFIDSFLSFMGEK